MKEKAEELLKTLEGDLVQLQANAAATEGAIQALKLLLEPEEEEGQEAE